MTKNEACPVCAGRGYTNSRDSSTSFRKWCGNCNGTGVIQVPMTRADRIRSLSDEELVDFCKNLMNLSDEDGGFFCQNKKECQEAMEDLDFTIPEEWCEKCLLEWLRKPAKEPKLPSGLFLDKQESGLVEED